MRDCFYKFLSPDAVLDSSAEVKSKLVGTIQCNKRSYRDQTSVALGQFFAFPNVSEKDVFRQLDQLGREVAEQVRDGRRRFIPAFRLLSDRPYAFANPSVILVVDD